MNLYIYKNEILYNYYVIDAYASIKIKKGYCFFKINAQIYLKNRILHIPYYVYCMLLCAYCSVIT